MDARDTDQSVSFFEGLQQAELLEAFGQMYQHRYGLAVVTTPSGAGMSTLAQHFVHELRATDDQYDDLSWASIDAANNTVGGFLTEVLTAFGYNLEDARQSELWSLTSVICNHQATAGLPPLISVEHLDRANPKILNIVNELATLKQRNQWSCRLILSGTEAIRDIVHAERMQDVAKRVTHELALQRLTDGEVRAFAAHILRDKQLSAHESAIDSLVRLSNGMPGLIVEAIERAAADADGEPLSSGDILLGLEASGALDTDAESGLPPTDATEIRKVALEVREPEAFAGSDKAHDDSVAPLGEILVNKNGKLVETHVISRRKLLIGRAPHNDIVLDSRWVSRHHAILICEPEGATLADVNSTNGLSINSRERRQGRLGHNDIIVIGDFRLKYINAKAYRGEDVDDGLTETRVLRRIEPRGTTEKMPVKDRDAKKKA